jgi:hypothetical protein
MPTTQKNIAEIAGENSKAEQLLTTNVDVVTQEQQSPANNEDGDNVTRTPSTTAQEKAFTGIHINWCDLNFDQNVISCNSYSTRKR